MTHPEPTGFAALGVADDFLQILSKIGITTPTPIQHSAIPQLLKGVDLIGIAQTGTGKTMAFGLPLIERLKSGGRALIILPTRELAIQVEQSLMAFAQARKIGIAVFIGGASMYNQRMMLKRNPRILIATPGRLIDHLEQRTVTLREVSVLVLDEADRMLDMGFAPQINKILAAVPKERQTMLFSATMPHKISELATKHMKLPVRVEVAPAGTAAEKVEQHVIIVQKQDKATLLHSLLKDIEGTVIVFMRTKHGAKKLTQTLEKLGHSVTEIHANRSLAQRRMAMAGFKSGRYRIMVATDIAARGIDVQDLGTVVNYDLPDNPEDYVHRIGRTGRAGKTGQAVSFATPDQRGDIRIIERLIRTTLPVSQAPAMAPNPTIAAMPPDRPDRPRGGFSRGGRGGGRRSFRR